MTKNQKAIFERVDRALTTSKERLDVAEKNFQYATRDVIEALSAFNTLIEFVNCDKDEIAGHRAINKLAVKRRKLFAARKD